MAAEDSTDRERRDVRSEDPTLSDETNRRLTAELREATGKEHVEVPRERPHLARERHGTHSTLGATLSENRDGIVITGAILLVVGAIVWLSTGSWWVMGVAVVLDLVMGAVVLAMVIRMTTAVEHASPELAARLEDEGVADPDGLLSDLVENVEEDDDGDSEERTVKPGEDPDKAGKEQRRSVTPSNEPSRPTGPGSDA